MVARISSHGLGRATKLAFRGSAGSSLWSYQLITNIVTPINLSACVLTYSLAFTFYLPVVSFRRGKSQTLGPFSDQLLALKEE